MGARVARGARAQGRRGERGGCRESADLARLWLGAGARDPGLGERAEALFAAGAVDAAFEGAAAGLGDASLGLLSHLRERACLLRVRAGGASREALLFALPASGRRRALAALARDARRWDGLALSLRSSGMAAPEGDVLLLNRAFDPVAASLVSPGDLRDLLALMAEFAADPARRLEADPAALLALLEGLGAAAVAPGDEGDPFCQRLFPGVRLLADDGAPGGGARDALGVLRARDGWERLPEAGHRARARWDEAAHAVACAPPGADLRLGTPGGWEEGLLSLACERARAALGEGAGWPEELHLCRSGDEIWVCGAGAPVCLPAMLVATRMEDFLERLSGGRSAVRFHDSAAGMPLQGRPVGA